MKLYETIENGEVKGFDDEVLKLLVQFVSLAPVDRGIDLRPYLPDEMAPSKKEKFINLKDEEPLPFRKPLRWEFPKNSMYYQQNI